jgi:hypothetical protein
MALHLFKPDSPDVSPILAQPIHKETPPEGLGKVLPGIAGVLKPVAGRAT